MKPTTTAWGGYAITGDMIWTAESIRDAVRLLGDGAAVEYTKDKGWSVSVLRTCETAKDTVHVYLDDLLYATSTEAPVKIRNPDDVIIQSLVSKKFNLKALFNMRIKAAVITRKIAPVEEVAIVDKMLIVQLRKNRIKSMVSRTGKLILAVSVGLMLTACSIVPYSQPKPAEPVVVNCPDATLVVDYTKLPTPPVCPAPRTIRIPGKIITCNIQSLNNIDSAPFKFSSYYDKPNVYIKDSKDRILYLEAAITTITKEYIKCLK